MIEDKNGDVWELEDLAEKSRIASGETHYCPSCGKETYGDDAECDACRLQL
jgi:predicted RNA-binding Zn-ribbon protein involved in translation (DUF1610 family)